MNFQRDAIIAAAAIILSYGGAVALALGVLVVLVEYLI